MKMKGKILNGNNTQERLGRQNCKYISAFNWKGKEYDTKYRYREDEEDTTYI